MSLNPKLTDTDRLRHMRDAACAALRFVWGRTRADLDTDEMLAFALVRTLEIIGEAADKLSDPALPPTRPSRGARSSACATN